MTRVAPKRNEGAVVLRHVVHYLAGSGPEGTEAAATFNQAIKRAVDLGAGSLAAALQMIAHEFVQGTEKP